jgi:8-oxo-dGTP pyrophosphatase MutT (NUDIX family)
MAHLEIGVVDVFVLRGAAGDLKVLVLRRGEGTRCTGAWETVHGRIDVGEEPQDAAIREVREETGLEISRLYNVICQPFYLHRLGTVQMAVVFAAFVENPDSLVLGPEHDAAQWLRPEEAHGRLDWPRSRAALNDVLHLLKAGHAGPVEDVLRVK